MPLKLYAFTCGTVTGEFARLMEGGEGDITVPVPVFLIEHPKGMALFDTGLHPDCQRDPAGRLGERLTGLFRIGFQPGEEVSARLEAIGRDPGEIGKPAQLGSGEEHARRRRPRRPKRGARGNQQVPTMSLRDAPGDALMLALAGVGNGIAQFWWTALTVMIGSVGWRAAVPDFPGL